MTDFPYLWPYSLFAPKNLDQQINPGWFDVNINNYAGNPQIEKDVVEKVASYGKQLGILTEAVLSLAGDPPKDGEDPIARLRDIANKIEALKDLNKASLENEARSAMARLAKFEPAKARSIATNYAKEPG